MRSGNPHRAASRRDQPYPTPHRVLVHSTQSPAEPLLENHVRRDGRAAPGFSGAIRIWRPPPQRIARHPPRPTGIRAPRPHPQPADRPTRAPAPPTRQAPPTAVNLRGGPGRSHRFETGDQTGPAAQDAPPPRPTRPRRRMAVPSASTFTRAEGLPRAASAPGWHTGPRPAGAPSATNAPPGPSPSARAHAPVSGPCYCPASSFNASRLGASCS